MANNPDVTVVNHGSILGLTIHSPAAKDWIEANVTTEGWQWLGNTLNVEPRYAHALVEGMQGGGLAVV